MHRILQLRAQMPPGLQANRLLGLDAHAGRPHQYESGHPRRKLCSEEPGNHAAKGKTGNVTGALTQQQLQALFNIFRQRVSIPPLCRTSRIAKTRQVRYIDTAPGRYKRANIAQPVRPAAAAAVKQQQRGQGIIGHFRGPDMPDHGAGPAGRFMAGRSSCKGLRQVRELPGCLGG